MTCMMAMAAMGRGGNMFGVGMPAYRGGRGNRGGGGHHFRGGRGRGRGRGTPGSGKGSSGTTPL